MYYNDIDQDKIKNAADSRLVEVVGDFITLRARGKELSGECPKCKGEFSFKVSEGKR